MQVRAFRLLAEGAPEPVDLEVALAGLAGDDHAYWIDIERVEPGGLEELLDRLRVVPFLRTEVLSGASTPLASSLGQQALLRLPAQIARDEREGPVTLVLVASCIVTLHAGPSDMIRALEHAEIEAAGLELGTPGALLASLIEVLLHHDLDLVAGLRAEVDALAALRGEELADVEPEELATVRLSGDALAAMLEDQLFCLGALPAIALPPPHAGDLRRQFTAGHQALEHLGRVLERALRRLDQVLDQRSLLAQDAASRRLKVLTVVQAVFVPLTLIAGIYGMNFAHMPELGWRGAYFVVLGTMGLVAGMSLLLFWRKGWFD